MCILLEDTDFLTVGTYGCYNGKSTDACTFLNVTFFYHFHFNVKTIDK